MSTNAYKLNEVLQYNEAENIRDCAIAMRESTPLSVDNLEVLIVDDRSTDDTKAIGETLQQHLNDPRLKILAGQSIARF
ncbi:glycosyltransferase [Microcoleus sp. AT8-B1]|uniref:glycosyltransferase n=1 Tax=unclassified Microcoleus TaxID=2642155 RepID=UPI002FD68FFF